MPRLLILSLEIRGLEQVLHLSGDDLGLRDPCSYGHDEPLVDGVLPT